MANENLQLPPELTIGDLFAKDPYELTNSDLDRMIGRLREARLNWRKEEEAAKATGRRPKADKHVTLEMLDL